MYVATHSLASQTRDYVHRTVQSKRDLKPNSISKHYTWGSITEDLCSCSSLCSKIFNVTLSAPFLLAVESCSTSKRQLQLAFDVHVVKRNSQTSRYVRKLLMCPGSEYTCTSSRNIFSREPRLYSCCAHAHMSKDTIGGHSECEPAANDRASGRQSGIMTTCDKSH